jgi:hypothetical protein
VSAENLSAAADVPAVAVPGGRLRVVQIAAAFLLPLVAIAIVLTLPGSGTGAPLRASTQNGTYTAVVGTPLTVTAFRFANTGKAAVTIRRLRIAHPVEGLEIVGGLAYRGCAACVTDSAVPPHITPPPDVTAPPLLPLASFELRPGQTLTVLLSVKLSREGTVHVPPLRVDTAGRAGARAMQTKPGPQLCAGKHC